MCVWIRGHDPNHQWFWGPVRRLACLARWRAAEDACHRAPAALNAEQRTLQRSSCACKIFDMVRPEIEFRQLSIAERLELVHDIWDSTAWDTEVPPLTDAQKAALDRGLDQYRRDPGSGISWNRFGKSPISAANDAALGFSSRRAR
ncbi:hypothetical protein HRbin33_01094 [bacterium HR33]|nr:hypothetical protein HRbin33_01094 [bacterium HR33]